ncbi:MAG: hypothetical protein EA402_02305 [Planctomycetota bacterium]|nr:MAG: hypothetical protein EA402_02305 [Planctomycetota bacterium]
MESFPCFIDFEASSLSERSYPIAMAWNLADGTIRRFLISPQGIDDWNDWDPASEAIHQIDRQRLISNGWAPDFVAEEFEHDLGNRRAWADAPDFDNHWLQRLYQAAGRQPPCRIGHLEDLLTPLLRHQGELEWQAAARLSRLISDLETLRRDRHDAGADVGWLIRLWEAAHGKPLRPNHGIGPIPGITDTGTFYRRKSRQ